MSLYELYILHNKCAYGTIYILNLFLIFNNKFNNIEVSLVNSIIKINILCFSI